MRWQAHAVGIVHRDLKPANLFLATDGECTPVVKVLDFGIAKVLGTDTGSDAVLTRTAGLLGSPMYMSPEQLEAARDVDARSDVWSLGVILFELITGAQPFVADSLPMLFKRVLERPAPLLRSMCPEAPAALEAVVSRCLAKNRNERFADAAALASALAPLAPTDVGQPASPKGSQRNAATRGSPGAGTSGGASGARGEEASSSEGAFGRSSRIEPKAAAISTRLAAGSPTGRLRSAANVLLALAVAAGAVLLWRWRIASSHDAPPPASTSAAASSLAASTAVLACPPLVAHGVRGTFRLAQGGRGARLLHARRCGWVGGAPGRGCRQSCSSCHAPRSTSSRETRMARQGRGSVRSWRRSEWAPCSWTVRSSVGATSSACLSCCAKQRMARKSSGAKAPRGRSIRRSVQR